MRVHRTPSSRDSLRLEDENEPIGRIDRPEHAAFDLTLASGGQQVERDPTADEGLQLLVCHAGRLARRAAGGCRGHRV